MSKVIWYLHHYAGAPSLGMSYRPYYLAREFQALGLKPYIIAASFHHLVNKKLSVSRQVSFTTIDDAPYIWLKTPAYQGNGIKRILNMLSYAFKLRWFAKRIVNITQKPDVIIVSSSHLFHYLSARWLAKKYQAKLLFEVRDIWPLSLVEIVGVSKSHPLIQLMSWIETLAYKEADYVVSLLPNAFEHMQRKGLTRERFVYIPNGVSHREYPAAEINNPPICEKIIQLKQQQKFIIGYLGAHGLPNALDQLIAAMAILQQRGVKHIHAVLVGKGIEKERLKEQANMLDNIIFSEPISKAETLLFLSHIDAAFIGWRALPIYRYGVSPNKIFDYMYAAKPIVHAVDTLYDPVQQAGCGIIVSPEQPALLADAFINLAATPASELKQMGERGRAYVNQHHRYDILARRYSDLF